MRCGVRDARHPKPPSIEPTFATPRTSPYDISSSQLGSHSSTASSTGAHAQDRVLVAPARAERRVDERPVRREPQPQRAEVREHELVLRRLAEDAHVGDAAVRHEIARPGRVAAVLGALRVALLRLLDLARDRRDQHVAAQPHARVLSARTAST